MESTKSAGIDGPVTAQRSRLAAALKNVALIVLVTVAAIMLVEAGLRVFGMYRPPEYPEKPSRPDLFVGHPKFGYHLWPLSRMCMRYPANTHRLVSVISNSDGFASSRNFGEPDPRPRVLVIGDSFTMGLGVNEGTRYTEVVEDVEPRWRVDNMGIVGWGLDLMVRALEALGEKAKPDVVVFAVYTESLARLSPRWQGQAPTPFRKYKLVDGTLVDTPPFQLSFWHNLHVSELMRTVQERVGGTQVRNQYPLNEALLDRFLELTKQLNATPVVVFFPGTHDTVQGRERRAFLRSWAESKGVVHGDFTDVVHRAGVEKTYIPNNFHWDEYGHEVAGRALHELLATRVLRGKGADIDTRTLPPPPWRQQRYDFCSDRSDSTQGK
ncbi:MAG: SGNH/GDSL hydrolase family protein [Gemmatimonadaceae bacterium]